VHADRRKAAKALLQRLGQAELAADPAYRFSSAKWKLAIAQAAQQAAAECNPLVLQQALEAARARLDWIL
jgi:hypothetical protein